MTGTNVTSRQLTKIRWCLPVVGPHLVLLILSQYVSSIEPIFGTPLVGTGEPNRGGEGGGESKAVPFPEPAPVWEGAVFGGSLRGAVRIGSR